MTEIEERNNISKDKLKECEEVLVREALEMGAANAAIANVSDIMFCEDLRNMCSQNLCGKYNTNWMCPPAVGSFSDMREKVLKFKHGLLFQTIYQLEDSFDFEGMMEAKLKHEKVFRKIYDKIERSNEYSEILALNAGACEICEECSYKAGEKCRFPEKAVPSVESCGINVTELVTCNGIPYNNGVNTVSYVGMILFKK